MNNKNNYKKENNYNKINIYKRIDMIFTFCYNIEHKSSIDNDNHNNDNTDNNIEHTSNNKSNNTTINNIITINHTDSNYKIISNIIYNLNDNEFLILLQLFYKKIKKCNKKTYSIYNDYLNFIIEHRYHHNNNNDNNKCNSNDDNNKCNGNINDSNKNNTNNNNIITNTNNHINNDTITDTTNNHINHINNNIIRIIEFIIKIYKRMNIKEYKCIDYIIKYIIDNNYNNIKIIDKVIIVLKNNNILYNRHIDIIKYIIDNNYYCIDDNKNNNDDKNNNYYIDDNHTITNSITINHNNNIINSIIKLLYKNNYILEYLSSIEYILYNSNYYNIIIQFIEDKEFIIYQLDNGSNIIIERLLYILYNIKYNKYILTYGNPCDTNMIDNNNISDGKDNNYITNYTTNHNNININIINTMKLLDNKIIINLLFKRFKIDIISILLLKLLNYTTLNKEEEKRIIEIYHLDPKIYIQVVGKIENNKYILPFVLTDNMNRELIYSLSNKITSITAYDKRDNKCDNKDNIDNRNNIDNTDNTITITNTIDNTDTIENINITNNNHNTNRIINTIIINNNSIEYLIEELHTKNKRYMNNLLILIDRIYNNNDKDNSDRCINDSNNITDNNNNNTTNNTNNTITITNNHIITTTSYKINIKSILKLLVLINNEENIKYCIGYIKLFITVLEDKDMIIDILENKNININRIYPILYNNKDIDIEEDIINFYNTII